jgi:hypothetical protein
MLISFPIENSTVGVENEEVLAMAADTQTIEVLADGEVTGDHADTRSRVVTIDNRDSGDTIKLRVPVTMLLSAVIETMYAEFRLTRQSDDRLTCRHNGEDVFQFAHETLERYLDQGHCPGLHWSFVGDTGGA